MPPPQPADLIQTAVRLFDATAPKPSPQTDLRRAVSTAYYALFHALAACCADLLVGHSSSRRGQRAWLQAYRALDHRPAKNRCEQVTSAKNNMDFPDGIVLFAEEFVNLQRKRERADYHPDAEFFASEVQKDILFAAFAVDLFEGAPEEDRRAFAVWVLLRVRS